VPPPLVVLAPWPYLVYLVFLIHDKACYRPGFLKTSFVSKGVQGELLPWPRQLLSLPPWHLDVPPPVLETASLSWEYP
jgi:hypothetical protein